MKWSWCGIAACCQHSQHHGTARLVYCCRVSLRLAHWHRPCSVLFHCVAVRVRLQPARSLAVAHFPPLPLARLHCHCLLHGRRCCNCHNRGGLGCFAGGLALVHCLPLAPEHHWHHCCCCCWFCCELLRSCPRFRRRRCYHHRHRCHHRCFFCCGCFCCCCCRRNDDDDDNNDD